jgi:protein-disulfide isomerase
MKRILPFIIILAVLGVALGSAWYLTRTQPASSSSSGGQTTQSPGSQVKPSPVAVRTGVPGAEPPHTMGPPTAPVHLEEFGDFECPPCGAFHPILKEMKEQFGNNLHITFREYPLTQTHPHALAAASAAEAAGMQGQFWEMHGLIFDHQKDWRTQFDVRSVFEGYAKQIGLDVERFKRDVDSDRVEQRIFLDGKRAHSMGVGSTPTVFMNGRELPFEELAPERLRVLIENELRAAAGQK